MLVTRVAKMLARLGDVIYWFGCIVAAVILALGVSEYWFGQGGLSVLGGWMALAAIPWAVGSAVHFILTSRW